MSSIEAIDTETGESLGILPKRILKKRGLYVAKDAFTLVFYGNLSVLKDEFAFRLYLIGVMKPDNTLRINMRFIKRLRQKFDATQSWIYRMIKKNVDSGIMLKLNSGDYMINPSLFTKCNYQKRETLVTRYNLEILSQKSIKKSIKKKLPANVIPLRKAQNA